MDMDGSNVTDLATVNSSGPSPKWIPGTNTVVYLAFAPPEKNGASYLKLFTVEPSGAPKLFFTTDYAPEPAYTGEPTPSADGRWLYFTADPSDQRGCYYLEHPAPCVFRSSTSGSVPELIIDQGRTHFPAPSPDGSQVAYYSGGLRVFDTATRTTSTWSVDGAWAAWSPDGTRIAYLTLNTQQLSFVAPDGTGQRSLATRKYDPGILWTPDGKWILAQSAGLTYLVDPDTGKELLLPYLAGRIVTSVK
jgi:Tol biopolymer transport system component